MDKFFEFGIDIMSTSVSAKTKKILATTGSNVGDGLTLSNNVEWWQHVGFASRPANPEKGKQAAQALVVRSGTFDCAIGSQDLRGLSLYGQLAPGETCVYGAGADGTAQGRMLIKANGSVNIYTRKDNGSSGAGMGIFVNPDGSISIASHTGAAVLLGTDGSVKVFNGSGGIQILADGTVKVASSGSVNISGASVALGGPSAVPVALAPYTAAALESLQNQVTAIASALSGFLPALGAAIGSFAPAYVAATQALVSKRTVSD